MDSSEMRSFLASPDAVHAINSGNPGAVVRLVRTALRMRQAELGALIGRSQSAVSRLENGEKCDVDGLARVIGPKLGIPAEALGFTHYGSAEALGHQEVGAVKRKDLIRGFIGAAAMLAFPSVLNTDKPQRQLTSSDVEDCREIVARVDQVDTEVGGEAVYELSAELANRIQRLARSTSYVGAVGRELHSVLATAYETAGWLAYDASRYVDARRHWLECLHLADMHQLHVVRATVMADMALHATYRGWGTEAVEVAQAAARGKAVTPRVASLLAAREGLGHAINRDASAANEAFVRSARLLDRGTSANDPAWVAFWGPDDFACHRSKAALLLGSLSTAEQAARAALRGAQAGPFTRNQALYGVRVGHILARRRAIDEAMATVRPIVAGPIGSGRVRAELRHTVATIGAEKGYRPAKEFAAWASVMLGAA